MINAGVCGALNNRLERGAVYRVSMVSIEQLKAAVNVGVGIGLKRLVSVDEPIILAFLLQDSGGDLLDSRFVWGWAVAGGVGRNIP